MISRTKAIANFLATTKAPVDLINLYTPEMECQVSVKKGANKPLKGQEYKGHKYNAYQDIEDGTIYKPFRIPYDSMKESAHYTDPPMSFDLAKYADGIGLTGWNFVQKRSEWLGYDFDSMVNHKKGLTAEELENIQKSVTNLDYVTVRKSTTGSGIHIYVFVDNVPTVTHTEHSALARSVLNKMSLDSGYDLQSKVDQLGSILWVWAEKFEGTNGLQLLKKGSVLKDVPLNWRQHADVIKGKKHKIRPDLIKEEELDDFNELAIKRLKTPLDDTHRKIIEELSKETEYETFWNSDYGMLITHTVALKNVHKRLSLEGPFETASSSSSPKNCFAFPLKDGSWSVRRHGRGVVEASTWISDFGGWTHCYFNRKPDFRTACMINGGVEDVDSGFVFREARSALKAAKDMGVALDIAEPMQYRETKLKVHPKNKKLVVEVTSETKDESIVGWIKKGKNHLFISKFSVQDEFTDQALNDMEEIRHCVSPENVDAGWYILGMNGKWVREPKNNVQQVLSSMGYSFKEREIEMGKLITNYWTLTNEPFQAEYLGNRVWNKDAAQFKFTKLDDPFNLHYPHWSMILDHLGKGLDDAVAENPWCQEFDIVNGAGYLKCWIASLFQYPDQPLPYLFFYGKEDTGKSMFHESIELLVTKGVGRIDYAITNSSDFNGEIAGLVLGVIEETNLTQGRGTRSVLNKVKDWVTSRQIAIHYKKETPYMEKNTMHIVQCSNDMNAVPVFPGDTRVVVINVPKLQKIIPKSQMIDALKKEGQQFLTELLNMIIPASPSRLRIPIIETAEKMALADSNMSDIERFIKEKVYLREGCVTSLSDVWASFCDTYSPMDLTINRFNRIFQTHTGCVKGRYGSGAQHHWANVSLKQDEECGGIIIKEGDFLKRTD